MSDNKCRDCSAAIPEGAKFCPSCGAPVKADEAGSKTGGKKRNSLRDNLIIVVVIAVIAVGYILLRQPQEPPQPPQQTADTTQDMGNNPHGDMDALMAALPNIPTDYEGLVNMGNTNMDQGNFALAAECYKRALAQKPDAYDVRTDFGACLHGMGLNQRALEEFQQVIKGHPEHAIANFNLGIVHYSLQNMDSARYYWQKYLKLDPNGKAAPDAKKFLEQLDK